RRRHTRWPRDWSSDVCSSDLEFNPSKEQQKALFQNAEHYARRAVAANPNDAEGHFELARAIGKNALTMGARDKVKFAADVREQRSEERRVGKGWRAGVGRWHV